jgi:hypothetical protein
MYVHCNVEFAHIELEKDGKFNPEYLQLSCDAAAYFCSELSQRGLSYTTSVLIDDEELGNRADISLVKDLLEQAKRSLKIDFICWESRLHRHVSKLIDLIVPERRENIGSKIERYIKRHGHVACSHNIAIWHMLRLGAFAYEESDLIFPYTDNSSKQYQQMPSAKFAVSILSGITNYMQDSEFSAEKDILRFIEDNSYLDRIKRIYFNEKDNTKSDLDMLIAEVTE